MTPQVPIVIGELSSPALEEGEEDFDKKMGGLGEENSEQLDRKMWAPEEEEEQVCLLL